MCNHTWKEYLGFTERYDYCEQCGVKFKDAIVETKLEAATNAPHQWWNVANVTDSLLEASKIAPLPYFHMDRKPRGITSLAALECLQELYSDAAVFGSSSFRMDVDPCAPQAEKPPLSALEQLIKEYAYEVVQGNQSNAVFMSTKNFDEVVSSYYGGCAIITSGSTHISINGYNVFIFAHEALCDDDFCFSDR